MSNDAHATENTAFRPLAWLRAALPKKKSVSQDETSAVADVSSGDVSMVRPIEAPKADAEASGIERRRFDRVAVELSVTMESDHNFFMGFSENISEGGLFIATHQVLPLGHELDLTFTLPGGREVKTRARVQWVRPYNAANSDAAPGMGVQFIGLDESVHEWIVAFVQKRDPLFFG